MSSGWGCQHLTTFEEYKEWCRLLKKNVNQVVMVVYFMENFFLQKKTYPLMKSKMTERLKTVLTIL